MRRFLQKRKLTAYINPKLDEIATDLKDAMGRLEAGQRVMDLEDWS